jgi:hypothetical protein
MKLSEVINSMNGWELLEVESEFKREFNELGALRALLAAAWVTLNRKEPTSWASVKSMALTEIQALFDPEDEDPLAENSDGGS